jgi:hypothetical protein
MKSKKKRRWLWIVVIIIAISSIIAIFGQDDGPAGDSDSKIEVTPTPEPLMNEVCTATFDEIYRAYKDNELVADDMYKHNRYQITAKIDGMTNDGLFNLTGGATLTLETKVDNTIVVFYAEFEKDQEDNLKTVKVGDTITFIGECLSAGSWSDCEMIAQ